MFFTGKCYAFDGKYFNRNDPLIADVLAGI